MPDPSAMRQGNSQMNPLRALLLATLLGGSALAAGKPNIVFLIADDLGYGDLSCYGQQRFKTPNIDRLASEGMRFTAHYSGHNVCAPSRCVLMTGKHPGHAYIRDNRGGLGPEGEGQEPVPAGELKLPLTLKKLGYTLGGFGKWGLGGIGTSGEPARQGFDRLLRLQLPGRGAQLLPDPPVVQRHAGRPEQSRVQPRARSCLPARTPTRPRATRSSPGPSTRPT